MRLSTPGHADRLWAFIMMPAQQMATLNAANCEVAFDNLTRQLYATDASPYQIVPLAVAFPKNATQASSIIQAAAQAGVSVTPRGAGTGLAGGAIGDGLVIDFARHNRLISKFNPETPHHPRRRRRGAGSIERFPAAAGFLFRPGRGHEFARDAGRHDCQRFVGRARAVLWHDGHARERTENRPGRRGDREGRSRPATTCRGSGI